MEEMKPRALEWIDERAEWLSSIAKDIWLHPELAMEEHYCSALVADTLEREGFVVERGVAGMPTAFVATWGSGSPTVGFLCEYDALPGLSNDTVAERKPLVEEGPGHGCGHNLIGAGTAGAGMAVRSVLAEKKLPGTVKVYGTPAEETLAGKVFMAREGIFDGMDACLTWHPSWFNEINYETCLALYSIKFTFRGQTCHIPSRPQDGKNAIDSVELMNVAANMRRKHLPPGMTFEYVVLRGGAFPNVVPDLAEVWYFVRAHEVGQVKAGVEELQNAARGAALALGTEVTWRILTGCYPLLPNRTFSELLYENFQQVGPPQFSQEEQAFAEELRKTFEMREGEPLHTGLRFIGDRVGPFSQDAGDVSRLCPLALVHASSWLRGVSNHTWPVTVTSGMSIGFKAMITATQVMALGALDLFTKPERLRAIRQEFRERTGSFQYECLAPAEVQPLEFGEKAASLQIGSLS